MSYRSWRRRATRCAVAGLLAPVVGAALVTPAAAAPNNNSSDKLRKAVTVDGVLEHLNALEAIAEANPVNGVPVRASGTAGYDASAAYVADRLRAAGYAPTIQTFDFPFYAQTGPATFTVGTSTYAQGVDYEVMEYSPGGDASGQLAPVDVNLTGSRANSSGCEPSDFAGFPTGGVAVVQRGTCTFATKAANAEDAGAVAVVIFNQGSEGRFGLLTGTLGGPDVVTIPVLETTYALGETLVSASGQPAQVVVQAESEIRQTSNVIAETATGRADQVVMAGAHLDSTLDGPAINDDGSGSAALLEIAEQMAKTKPNNKVRFAWFGAEENGLVGSEYYVGQLSQTQLSSVALMLNFDMLGSPNFARFYYDVINDGTTDAKNDAIQDVFASYFAGQGLPAEGNTTDLSAASSDYGPFGAVGVPVGGLFTGAGGVKTSEQAARYGGTAGVAYDPNYHTDRDTVSSLSVPALDQMTDAAAHAIITFAHDVTAVGGERVPGKSHGKAKKGGGAKDKKGARAAA